MGASVSDGRRPSLLPPNATPFESEVEQAAARAADVPVPLRDLWDPDTCPAELLPWLAWALSVDDWKSYWPERVKRSRIRSAIAIQRRKGTLASVRAVVESFGGSLMLREWWQMEPRGEPHTFNVLMTIDDASGQEATARLVDDVIAEVSRTKPVRSHFTFTQGMQASGRIGTVAAARVANYRRLRLTGD